MKKTSCGVILTDMKGDRLLSIVPWGHKQSLDIPKGPLEEGEYPVSCALRELREETGIVLRASELTDLGVFTYTAEKRLRLFLYRTNKLPDVAELKCISMMSNPISPEMPPVPEAVGFELAFFEDPRFYKSLQPVLRRVKALL